MNRALLKLLRAIVRILLALSILCCIVSFIGAVAALLVSVLSVIGVRNGSSEFMAVVMFFLFAVVSFLLFRGCDWASDRLKEKIEAEPGHAKGSGCLIWVLLIVVIIVIIVLIAAFFSPSPGSPVSVP